MEYRTRFSTDNISYQEFNEIQTEIVALIDYLNRYGKKLSFTPYTYSLNEFPKISNIQNIETGIDKMGKALDYPEGWINAKDWTDGGKKLFGASDINRWINNMVIVKTYSPEILKAPEIIFELLDTIYNEGNKTAELWGVSFSIVDPETYSYYYRLATDDNWKELTGDMTLKVKFFDNNALYVRVANKEGGVVSFKMLEITDIVPQQNGSQEKVDGKDLSIMDTEKEKMTTTFYNVDDIKKWPSYQRTYFDRCWNKWQELKNEYKYFVISGSKESVYTKLHYSNDPNMLCCATRVDYKNSTNMGYLHKVALYVHRTTEPIYVYNPYSSYQPLTELTDNESSSIGVDSGIFQPSSNEYAQKRFVVSNIPYVKMNTLDPNFPIVSQWYTIWIFGNVAGEQSDRDTYTKIATINYKENNEVYTYNTGDILIGFDQESYAMYMFKPPKRYITFFKDERTYLYDTINIDQLLYNEWNKFYNTITESRTKECLRKIKDDIESKRLRDAKSNYIITTNESSNVAVYFFDDIDDVVWDNLGEDKLGLYIKKGHYYYYENSGTMEKPEISQDIEITGTLRIQDMTMEIEDDIAKPDHTRVQKCFASDIGVYSRIFRTYGRGGGSR